jgi:uncharacterized phage-associated protein
METCHKIAKYFLGLVDDELGDSLSNLKLQKLMYYAQGVHLAMHGSPLFPEAIEAWEHGPVVPELYHSFKQHGSEPIPPDETFDPSELSQELRDMLNEVYAVYGQFSASQLRTMTHDEAPWKQTSRGFSISQDALAEYFKTQLV